MTPSVRPVAERIAALAFDCANPGKLAAFWQRILGGEVVVDRNGDAELRGPAVRLDFLQVPEPKRSKNRLHLDLRPYEDDFDEAINRALEAGAIRADDIYAGDQWQVLRDPEGNEFCILRP